MTVSEGMGELLRGKLETCRADVWSIQVGFRVSCECVSFLVVGMVCGCADLRDQISVMSVPSCVGRRD